MNAEMDSPSDEFVKVDDDLYFKLPSKSAGIEMFFPSAAHATTSEHDKSLKTTQNCHLQKINQETFHTFSKTRTPKRQYNRKSRSNKIEFALKNAKATRSLTCKQLKSGKVLSDSFKCSKGGKAKGCKHFILKKNKSTTSAKKGQFQNCKNFRYSSSFVKKKKICPSDIRTSKNVKAKGSVRPSSIFSSFYKKIKDRHSANHNSFPFNQAGTSAYKVDKICRSVKKGTNAENVFHKSHKLSANVLENMASFRLQRDMVLEAKYRRQSQCVDQETFQVFHDHDSPNQSKNENSEEQTGEYVNGTELATDEEAGLDISDNIGSNLEECPGGESNESNITDENSVPDRTGRSNSNSDEYCAGDEKDTISNETPVVDAFIDTNVAVDCVDNLVSNTEEKALTVDDNTNPLIQKTAFNVTGNSNMIPEKQVNLTSTENETDENEIGDGNIFVEKSEKQSEATSKKPALTTDMKSVQDNTNNTEGKFNASPNMHDSEMNIISSEPAATGEIDKIAGDALTKSKCAFKDTEKCIETESNMSNTQTKSLNVVKDGSLSATSPSETVSCDTHKNENSLTVEAMVSQDHDTGKNKSTLNSVCKRRGRKKGTQAKQKGKAKLTSVVKNQKQEILKFWTNKTPRVWCIKKLSKPLKKEPSVKEDCLKEDCDRRSNTSLLDRARDRNDVCCTLKVTDQENGSMASEKGNNLSNDLHLDKSTPYSIQEVSTDGNSSSFMEVGNERVCSTVEDTQQTPEAVDGNCYNSVSDQQKVDKTSVRNVHDCKVYGTMTLTSDTPEETCHFIPPKYNTETTCSSTEKQTGVNIKDTVTKTSLDLKDSNAGLSAGEDKCLIPMENGNMKFNDHNKQTNGDICEQFKAHEIQCSKNIIDDKNENIAMEDQSSPVMSRQSQKGDEKFDTDTVLKAIVGNVDKNINGQGNSSEIDHQIQNVVSPQLPEVSVSKKLSLSTTQDSEIISEMPKRKQADCNKLDLLSRKKVTRNKDKMDTPDRSQHEQAWISLEKKVYDKSRSSGLKRVQRNTAPPEVKLRRRNKKTSKVDNEEKRDTNGREICKIASEKNVSNLTSDLDQAEVDNGITTDSCNKYSRFNKTEIKDTYDCAQTVAYPKLSAKVRPVVDLAEMSCELLRLSGFDIVDEKYDPDEYCSISNKQLQDQFPHLDPLSKCLAYISVNSGNSFTGGKEVHMENTISKVQHDDQQPSVVEYKNSNEYVPSLPKSYDHERPDFVAQLSEDFAENGDETNKDRSDYLSSSDSGIDSAELQALCDSPDLQFALCEVCGLQFWDRSIFNQHKDECEVPADTYIDTECSIPDKVDERKECIEENDRSSDNKDADNLANVEDDMVNQNVLQTQDDKTDRPKACEAEVAIGGNYMEVDWKSETVSASNLKGTINPTSELLCGIMVTSSPTRSPTRSERKSEKLSLVENSFTNQLKSREKTIQHLREKKEKLVLKLSLKHDQINDVTKVKKMQKSNANSKPCTKSKRNVKRESKTTIKNERNVKRKAMKNGQEQISQVSIRSTEGLLMKRCHLCQKLMMQKHFDHHLLTYHKGNKDSVGYEGNGVQELSPSESQPTESVTENGGQDGLSTFIMKKCPFCFKMFRVCTFQCHKQTCIERKGKSVDMKDENSKSGFSNNTLFEASTPLLMKRCQTCGKLFEKDVLDQHIQCCSTKHGEVGKNKLTGDSDCGEEFVLQNSVLLVKRCSSCGVTFSADVFKQHFQNCENKAKPCRAGNTILSKKPEKDKGLQLNSSYNIDENNLLMKRCSSCGKLVNYASMTTHALECNQKTDGNMPTNNKNRPEIDPKSKQEVLAYVEPVKNRAVEHIDYVQHTDSIQHRVACDILSSTCKAIGPLKICIQKSSPKISSENSDNKNEKTSSTEIISRCCKITRSRHVEDKCGKVQSNNNKKSKTDTITPIATPKENTYENEEAIGELQAREFRTRTEASNYEVTENASQIELPEQAMQTPRSDSCSYSSCNVNEKGELKVILHRISDNHNETSPRYLFRERPKQQKKLKIVSTTVSKSNTCGETAGRGGNCSMLDDHVVHKEHKTKSNNSTVITEFEKALLTKDTISQGNIKSCVKAKSKMESSIKTQKTYKSKTESPVPQKDGKQKKKKENQKHVVKPKTCMVKRSTRASSTPVHFLKSKMAQKIYKDDQEKKLKEEKNKDGLPEFVPLTKPVSLPPLTSAPKTAQPLELRGHGHLFSSDSELSEIEDILQIDSCLSDKKQNLQPCSTPKPESEVKFNFNKCKASEISFKSNLESSVFGNLQSSGLNTPQQMSHEFTNKSSLKDLKKSIEQLGLFHSKDSISTTPRPTFRSLFSGSSVLSTPPVFLNSDEVPIDDNASLVFSDFSGSILDNTKELQCEKIEDISIQECIEHVDKVNGFMKESLHESGSLSVLQRSEQEQEEGISFTAASNNDTGEIDNYHLDKLFPESSLNKMNEEIEKEKNRRKSMNRMKDLSKKEDPNNSFLKRENHSNFLLAENHSPASTSLKTTGDEVVDDENSKIYTSQSTDVENDVSDNEDIQSDKNSSSEMPELNDQELEDVLDLFDPEEASFLNEPLYNWESEGKAKGKKSSVASDVKERSPKIEDTELKVEVADPPVDTDNRCDEPDTVKPAQTRKSRFGPIVVPTCTSQPILPQLKPLCSGRLKVRGRWMPQGWCFRKFNNQPCQQTPCMFKHDEPPLKLLLSPVYMSQLSIACKNGDADKAINMLESHEAYQNNVALVDLQHLLCSCKNKNLPDAVERIADLIKERESRISEQVVVYPFQAVPANWQSGMYDNVTQGQTTLQHNQGQVTSRQVQEQPVSRPGSAELRNYLLPTPPDVLESGSQQLRGITATNLTRMGVTLPSTWNSLASVYIEQCIKNPPVDVPILHELVTCLGNDVNAVGQAFDSFVDHTESLLEKNLKECPSLKLDRAGLCSIGKELFTMCYTGQNWYQACCVLEVCQRKKCSFLPATKLMVQALDCCLKSDSLKLAAQLILETPIKDFPVAVRAGTLSRFGPVLQRLCEGGLCMDAFNVLKTAFSLMFQSGVRDLDFCADLNVCEAASELILLSLRQRNIDIAGKVYTLVREYQLEARLRDDTNRSLLNALCSVKRFIYARDIFEQLKDTILFSEQSFEAPRCIYLHRSNTLAEIVMIIKDYLACLYSKYVELVRDNVSLSSQHLKLNIAFNPNSRFTVDRQELPYVPRAPVQLQTIQRHLQRPDMFSPTLLAELEADVLTLLPKSLEQYLQTLDENGMKQNLDFHTCDQTIRVGRQAARTGLGNLKITVHRR